MLRKTEKILEEAETIVGTSKFIGEIWKSMLRTPRARLSAIKFLGRRIPKDIEAAVKNVQHKIYVSQYNLVIRNGTLTIEDYNPDAGLIPEWAEPEIR